MVRNSVCSCSTLLCFRLCRSACGTVSGLLVMKIAVPGTRVGGCASSPSRKGLSGMPCSVSRRNMRRRPRFHVMSSVNTVMPMRSGNHPPDRNFIALEAKKTASTAAMLRITTPVGHHEIERVRDRVGVGEHEGGLTEVVEEERGKHEREPADADRLLAEVAHVGVERLAPGEREEDRTEDEEPRERIGEQEI